MRHFKTRFLHVKSSLKSMGQYNFAANSITGFLFNYIQTRKLDVDHIANFRERLEDALWVYLSAGHMQIVLLEIYEKGAAASDKPVEILDLKCSIKDLDGLSASERRRFDDEDLNVSRKDVMKQVQEMDDLSAPTDSTAYRILIGLRPKNDVGHSVPQVDESIDTTRRADVPDPVVRDSEDDTDSSGATGNSLVWHEVVPRGDQ